MPESGPFPAGKFGRNLETALVESRDTMGVLFTQPEIAMMGQLKGVALNANTVPAVTANVNRSGTAIAQRLIDQFGPVGRGAQIAVTRLLAPFMQVGRNQAASRSEEHTSELQSLMRISYAVFCLQKKKTTQYFYLKPPLSLHTRTIP